MKGIINWCAPEPTDYKGKVSLNFKMGDEFFNCYETEKSVWDLIKKGNEISFEVDAGAVKKVKLIKEAEKKPAYSGPRRAQKDEPWLKQQGVYGLASCQVIAVLKMQGKTVDLKELHNLTIVQAKDIYRSFVAGEMEKN